MPVAEKAVIHIVDFLQAVHIGCTDVERNQKQDIKVSMTMSFRKLPKACETDRLEDTLCYHRICDIIAELCRKQHFNTLEKVAATILVEVKKEHPRGVAFKIRIHKVAPPIEGLLGGAHFELELNDDG